MMNERSKMSPQVSISELQVQSQTILEVVRPNSQKDMIDGNLRILYKHLQETVPAKKILVCDEHILDTKDRLLVRHVHL